MGKKIMKSFHQILKEYLQRDQNLFDKKFNDF